MPKILLVEDEEDLAENLVNWLTIKGYLVEHADTGEQAQLLIKEAGYDIIILDWELPGEIQGPEL